MKANTLVYEKNIIDKSIILHAPFPLDRQPDRRCRQNGLHLHGWLFKEVSFYT